MIRLLFFKLIQWFIRTLPVSFSFSLAQFLSDCQYYLSIKDRKAVESNIKSLESDPKRIDYLTREVFRNFGKYLIEFLWMHDHFDSEYVKRNVKINGIKYLEEAYSKNNGVLAVSGHIGTWELGASALSLLGYPTSAIALEHNDSHVNSFFNKQRESKGLDVIPLSCAARESLKALKNKKLIAIVADRDFNQKSQHISFLNKTAQIPRGPAMFSIRSGAPIVPVFFMRGKEPLTFEFNMYPPIYPDRFKDIKDEKDKISAIMQEYIKIIEKVIKDDPSQWLLFREYDE